MEEVKREVGPLNSNTGLFGTDPQRGPSGDRELSFVYSLE